MSRECYQICFHESPYTTASCVLIVLFLFFIFQVLAQVLKLIAMAICLGQSPAETCEVRRKQQDVLF